MTYKELMKAYVEATKKCSELEKQIEEKDLRIEHLTELVLKRNKMLFGQKSEKGKYLCDGQLSFEGIFNPRSSLIFPFPNSPKKRSRESQQRPASIAAEKRSEQTLRQRRSFTICRKISGYAVCAVILLPNIPRNI